MPDLLSPEELIEYQRIAALETFISVHYLKRLLRHAGVGQAAIALWREHEWVLQYGGPHMSVPWAVCAVCNQEKEDGHAADCKLKEMLGD